MKISRRISEIPISEFMTRNVISIDPNAPLERLNRIFEEHNFNAVPVIENNKLIGVVNKVDFMTVFRKSMNRDFKIYRELMQLPVKEVMRQAVIALNPEDTIEKALEYMIGFRLRGIPVVNVKKDILGIVSRNDIVKKLMQEDIRNND
ncbi:MAG: CBS domain-containing protein [Thermoplasmata archaeon]|nr:CBS domain-containing protein [Thermoplasmata archaeon]